MAMLSVPVRALQRFLQIANPFCKPNQRFLFILMLGIRASVDTLRNWVKETLLEAGIQAPAGSCRSAVSSAAVARNMEIDLVMKAAGWARESTFPKYYQRAVNPGLLCDFVSHCCRPPNKCYAGRSGNLRCRNSCPHATQALKSQRLQERISPAPRRIMQFPEQSDGRTWLSD